MCLCIAFTTCAIKLIRSLKFHKLKTNDCVSVSVSGSVVTYFALTFHLFDTSLRTTRDTLGDSHGQHADHLKHAGLKSFTHLSSKIEEKD